VKGSDTSSPPQWIKLKEDENYIKNGYDLRWTVNNDTLKVNGKCVVFYTISEKEFALFEKNKTEEDVENVYDLIDDFIYYTGLAGDSIEKSNSYIKLHYTTSRFIEIAYADNKKLLFDKYNDCDIYLGYLISNGKDKPTISCGTDMDAAILEEIYGIIKKD